MKDEVGACLQAVPPIPNYGATEYSSNNSQFHPSIGGFLPFTTVDYPGKLAAVVFFVGCPMRCVYCSNPHLLKPDAGSYDDEKILDWLKERMGKLEAVVFSGGEALMQGDAAVGYFKKVKDMGLLVGLHTNGFYPDVLKSVINVVDWVGLDFKAVERKYEKLVRVQGAYEKMVESLDLLLKYKKDFEIRTTADPRFVTKDDLLEIADFLSTRGVKNFAVQKYIPHFENDADKTTQKDRDKFFIDDELRGKIDGMFESVTWRY